MSNTIRLKRSSTAGDTPVPNDLEVGELAVNTADAKIFTKHTDGNIKTISGSGGGGGSYGNSDVDSHLNLSTAQTNEVLAYDGADYDWVAPGISSLSADNNPTLGTDLDCAGKTIQGNGNVNLNGTLTTKRGASFNGGLVRIQNTDTTITSTDELGRIEFSAPNEASGGNATGVIARIKVDSTSTFTSTKAGADVKIQLAEGSSTIADRFTFRDSGDFVLDNNGSIFFQQPSYFGMLTMPTLTQSQTYTFPNNTGTVALTTDIPAAVTNYLRDDASDTTSGTLTINGNGSTSGTVVADGSITMFVGGSTPAYIDLYCETNNQHRVRLQSPAHANYSGNVTVTLPTSTGTVALTSDVPSNVSDLTNDSGYLTGITAQSIKNLSDVYSSMSPSDGQVLTWSGSNTRWESVTPSTGGGGGAVNEAFKTIAVAGQSDIVADGATDTLTVVGGNDITVTTNASTDTLTIASTASVTGGLSQSDAIAFAIALG